MSKFFNILAPVYEKLHPGAKTTFNKIHQIGDFRASDIVVDVGGGTGRIAQFFIGKVARIVVVDVSEKMLSQCRKKHPELACMAGTGENIPLPNESADKIILVDAFHHMADHPQVIREIKRVLRSGGTAIIAEFNPATIGGKLIGVFEGLLRFDSIFYKPQSLADMFAAQNFNIEIFDERKRDYYIVARK